MRGRTLDDAFVILDEAAKYDHHADEDVLDSFWVLILRWLSMEISVRLIFRVTSSPVWLMLKKTQEHPSDWLCSFSAKDVVRHPVVAQIIRAYEPAPIKNEEREESQEETE